MPRAALICSRLAFPFLLAGLIAGCSEAAPERPDTPFDFYVLALSWSPSYCAVEGPDANRQQCEAEPAREFVVHGLWPQNESGWPEFCPLDEDDRFVPEELARQYLDIMPSVGLIGHQWRKHGSCTGLDQRGYLDTTREAFERISIPAVQELVRNGEADPHAVEASFIAANAGLPSDAVAVTCADGHIMEVRLCLSQDFGWRACPEVDRRACRADFQAMPLP